MDISYLAEYGIYLIKKTLISKRLKLRFPGQSVLQRIFPNIFVFIVVDFRQNFKLTETKFIFKISYSKHFIKALLIC